MELGGGAESFDCGELALDICDNEGADCDNPEGPSPEDGGGGDDMITVVRGTKFSGSVHAQRSRGMIRASCKLKITVLQTEDGVQVVNFDS